MSTPQQQSSSTARPLLERKGPFGLPLAFLILFGFFFLIPSAFRAARLGLNNKENNVKDWLPSDFVETSELEWFADHFAGESFVIATWPGCNAEDQRLKLLESKLRHECAATDAAEGIEDPALAEDYRKAKEYGVRLGLLPASRSFDNWGGQREKWFSTADGKWYYITPNGHLHRWEGETNGPAGLVRSIRRATGTHELKGTFVAAFADREKDDLANPFYNDPSLVCAPMFETVETGVSLANHLARDGGPLWPVDLTDQSRRGIVAKRRATDRLTGSLFAPPVPSGFAWTVDAFRQQLSPEQLGDAPNDLEEKVSKALASFADEHFDGDMKQFADADLELTTKAWYAVFDAMELSPPPRQTCLLITLTDIAQDNLAYALGRGVMGAPRGRLLELANDSGVQPASPPSMAPPPFNREEVESIAGAPPLRLGGPSVDNIAIDEEGTITLIRLVGYSILVGVVLSYLCFSSIKITMMVFVVGGSAAMLSMAFVHWTGGHVDAILMSMPSLVYVLGLSGAIHVINYYRDEVRQGGRSGAAGRALQHAFFPCSLAAVTTAIGLGSLYISNLTPISNFGLYSAIGVIATLAILFSYLPASLQTFITEPKQRENPKADFTAASNTSTAAPQQETWLSDAWASTGRWITKHHALVTVACLLTLVGVGLGLSKIKTSVQLLKLFDSQSRIIRDYAWMEENFGKLVPMELVLRVPPEMMEEQLAENASGNEDGSPGAEKSRLPLSLLQRVEAASRISHIVNETLGEPGLNIVGTATGAHTFLPPLPAASNGWSMTRSLFSKELALGRDEILANDYLALEQDGPYKGSELWRISLRVDALSDVDYGAFISTLRTSVEPVLRAYDTRELLIRTIESEFTGEGESPGKTRVLIAGATRPKSIAETQLISPENELAEEGLEPPLESRIRKRDIYLATLEELLAGESLPKNSWLDPSSETLAVPIGSEKWNKVIARFKYDAVLWVGEGPAPTTDQTGTRLVIDGTSVINKSVTHELVGDGIPEAAGAGPLQVVYTGVVPVVYKAQRTLLSSLSQSIGMAFILIAIVMVVLLNPSSSPIRMLRPGAFTDGFMSGAISMIPNVFPVLLVFGAMGHLGRLVDIGTMMTASVAMGVAVDDTIHFLSWFRSYLDQGYNRLKAVELTYRRVGPAMTQTTLIGGVGLFVFALSTFTPTQRFGTLMLVLLAAALVGDLILLPALLAGPLGRFFKPREGSPATQGANPELAVEIHHDAKAESTSQDEFVDKESLPTLKIHTPSKRTDRPHRMKGR